MDFSCCIAEMIITSKKEEVNGTCSDDIMATVGKRILFLVSRSAQWKRYARNTVWEEVKALLFDAALYGMLA